MNKEHRLKQNTGLNSVFQQKMATGLEPSKLLERADVVWSRMELKDDEVLLIKLALSSAAYAEEINEIVNAAFGKKRHQVLLFLEGSMEFTKVNSAEVGRYE